jgi:Tol biopolymer transport system component
MTTAASAQQPSMSPSAFTPRDLFAFEWAGDPAISPDGRRVVFGRARYDSITDGKSASLWIANTDGTDARPWLAAGRNAISPLWSPDGSRILFTSIIGGHPALIVRSLSTGRETILTKRADRWSWPSWSPDGRSIALMMFVPSARKERAELTPPRGANWGPPLSYTERRHYRTDGQAGGSGHTHVFVVSASGGTPRQVTDGPYDDGQPAWAPDSRSLVYAALPTDAASQRTWAAGRGPHGCRRHRDSRTTA